MTSLQFRVWDKFREAEEGGYSDDPSDHGGATRYGISKAAHPEVDMATLTREGASEIAERDYWQAVMGDDLPWPLNLVLADFGFHSGPGRALKELAREVGIDPDDIALDELVAKAKVIAETIGSVALAQHVHLRRVSMLARFVQGSGSQMRYAGGWWARTVRLAFLMGG